MTSESLIRSQTAKRRSSRMNLIAPVGLSGEDRHKCSFAMLARATNLNKHGAAVQLDRELSIGSTVIVQHQRGTEISARIVAQVSAVEGLRTYGIEFMESDERAGTFWGITFPALQSA